MKRLTIVLTVFLSLCCTQSILAQSMSEDQILRYAQEHKAAGEDEATIVSGLLQKGVTIQQLQQIRRKYSAQQDQLGALDLTNTNSGVSKSRSRINTQAAGEQYQQNNNYMIRSQIRGNRGMDNYTNDEKMNMLGREISFLDIDSLLYYQNLLRDESKVFGRDIFNNERLTFEPNMQMATPNDYVLGAGDHVIIDIWGASQETLEGDISPDGTVTIQGVGPVKLAGLTVDKANSTVRQRLGDFYNDSEIQLTLGSTRTIQVQVMGEVKAPGTYTLSALSSAFNALYMAGGISDIGTLRGIKVYRNGSSLAEIDVYDFIFNGSAAGNVRLQDNDVIVVGPYAELVKISGRVKRPMYYEMKPGESAGTVLEYSGGFAGDAFRKNIRLVRRGGASAEYSLHTVSGDDLAAFEVRDGDSIYVDSVAVRYSNMVELRGAVYHPGMYQVGDGISGVRDLIEAADGVREDAFLNRAVMHREKEDLTLEVLSVDLKGILNGTSPDVALRKNDVLFIPSTSELRNQQTLKINGEVVYPGTYQYADNTTIEDFVLQAGGLTDEASTAKVDVFRRVYDASATVTSDVISETFSFALKDGFVVDGDKGFVLQPYDEVVVRKSPLSSQLQSVSISGSVNFSGSYVMTTKSYRLTDLVEAAGGLTNLAYVQGARLERSMTEEERQQRQTSLRSQQIALYESSLTSANAINMERADSLLNMKLDVGNTYPVAINLEEAMKHPDGNENIELRENDRLIVPQYSSTVKISGEVMYPISINYKKGTKLKYYIKRAGGYASKANRGRIYAIYMNGSVELINKHSSRSIQPGCEIVIPTKDVRDKLSVTEWMSMGTTAASISTMIVSIANLLK